ncbi:hypothetical protein K2173_026152 [Erythroxylum novogranatense]|uniref:Uncharacterized protein n=1 Tax=Erythroxylum novogranatense TaxID=1862640 RepID=A0AAV8T8W9_9ROSI|nr:hypothetical protein K2173_026152 [Erythroxylum novogranatense]
MAITSLNPCNFFVLMILASSLFPISSEARRLKFTDLHGSMSRGTDPFFDGFYFEEIKSGGPSSGGKGHEHTNDQTLGEIKHSGPSPAEGHYYTTDVPKSLGGIKHSGPSPAAGHYYTTDVPKSLGGIKHSGPSPAEGHYYTTDAPKSVGGIKHSGPSSGQANYNTASISSAPQTLLGEIKTSDPSAAEGHSYTTSDPQTLGGMKNSGPSGSGRGHDYISSTGPKNLAGIKHTGSSPGEGH